MSRWTAIADLHLFVLYFLGLQLFLFLQKIYRVLTHTEVIPEGNARLCSIVYRRKRDPEEIARYCDFVSVHNRFIDTHQLDDSKWTLYCIDKDFAYFVQLPRDVTYYNAQRCPFVYVDLFHDAVLVAQVSLSEFVRFADEVAKKPQPATVFYTNTARCGSTLLAKMLHVDGVTHCVAEPLPLANLAIGMAEGLFTEQDVRRLLPRVITILRNNLPANTIAVIKTESTGARLVPFTDEVPSMRHLFSFRKNGINSVERVLKREEIGDLLAAFYMALPGLSNFVFGWLNGMEGRLYKLLKPDTPKKRAAIVYASPYAEYLRHKDRFAMPVVWFHDLIHDTENTLRRIFATFDIPEDLAMEAAKWKGEDSQKGTFLSQENLKHIETPLMTAAERSEMDRYAEVIGVPLDTLLDAPKEAAPAPEALES